MGKYADNRDKKSVSTEKLNDIVGKIDFNDPQVTPLPPPENWRETDSIMITAPGYWKLYSQVDRRWCAEGLSEAVGGEDACKEAKIKIEQFRIKFGKIPWDLRYYFEPRDLKKFKLANDNAINNKK